MSTGSSFRAPAWEAVGELGVDAATCAMWDASRFPPSFRLQLSVAVPALRVALIADIGDDIDGLILVRRDAADVTGVRIDFVDDVDDLPDAWTALGELHLPTGAVVLADPYRAPNAPHSRQLAVSAGTCRAEELHHDGDLEAVRITSTGRS